MRRRTISRREFIHLSGMGLGALALAACSPAATPEPTATATEPKPTETEAVEEPHAIVGDVLDFALSGDWPGKFGFVKFRLHAGFHRGTRAYFIRTDASNKDFADANGLVFVPLLIAAQNLPGIASRIYLFDNGSAEQLPVLSTMPSQEDYSPIWQIHTVTTDQKTVYSSVEELQAAESAGEVTIAPESIYVNYPVVKWEGGELPVDEGKEGYLGGGQLLEPVDVEAMTVTFKLHECFPSSRYIVTDTSAAPMAPMMSIAASAPLQKLLEEESAPGTDKIWVFANGIEGSGVMGFQPAIFGNRAGDPVWSPLWNHFTLRWNEEISPRVLRSADEVRAALDTGDVAQFNGTPDTHPNGFVVNCPVPVLAPNQFAG